MRYLLIPALLLLPAAAFADPKAPAPPAPPAASATPPAAPTPTPPPPPYAIETFPDRELEMCPLVSVTVERPASGGAWTLSSEGAAEWYACDEAPKGSAAAFAPAVRGSGVEGWRLVEAPEPVAVLMRGFVPFHEKALIAIGPKQKRKTEDMCAEGRPAHSVVCEGMADSPASDYLTWLRKTEAANKRATFFLERGALGAASSELQGVPRGENGYGNMSANGRFKTSQGYMTVPQFKQRVVAALKDTNAILKKLIAAKEARAAASEKP